VVAGISAKIDSRRVRKMGSASSANPAIVERGVIGPTLYVGLTMRSATEAISPLVDRLMKLIKVSHCVSGDGCDVEIALREALANAVLHGNRQDLRKKVHVLCRVNPGRELSLVIRDEGSGFDPVRVPDSTASENINLEGARGICLMNAFMDEVHFDQGGTAVRLR
jgi:serine/threonine-protein kinase RsbW